MNNTTESDGDPLNTPVDTEAYILLRITNVAIKQRLPCIIFIGFLSLIGIIGNIHVLALFPRSHQKPSTYTVFVITLSIIDLTTCLFHMPMEIFDLTRPYTFYSETGCKLFRFNNAFLLMSSALILVLIAFERYRRVCNPMKRQMTLTLSKKLCVVVIITSLVLTMPMYLFTGHHIQILQGNGTNATGYKCFISDEASGKAYAYGYLGFILLLFVTATIILIFSYVAISRLIFTRYTNIRRSQKCSNDVNAPKSTESSDSKYPVHSSQDSVVDSKFDLYKSPSFDLKAVHKTTTLRNTRPLFFITAIFVLGFTPYLLLLGIVTLDRTFTSGLNDAQLTVYQICFRLILVNNVCNPFIYGFTDARFKNSVRSFYSCQK